jgi:histidinol dehydrogenase
MRQFDTAKDDPDTIHVALTERPEEELVQVEAAVRQVLADVKSRGNEAVAEYTRRFDWPAATAQTLQVPPDELIQARSEADSQTLDVMSQAAKNIRAFHLAERAHLQSWTLSGQTGRSLGQIIQPVERVGLYIPGFLADYPSTVLMAAIPAMVAGVKEVILCTPPGRNGKIVSLVAAAAAELKIERVFRIGGAQAIGAMAYGTQTVPKVDVIAGPGSQYVNTAKRQVYGVVGIDMLAGPSEVAVIADENANPAFVAADLLAQTEHGPENRGVLFSPSAALLEAVKAEIESQRQSLDRREILEKSANNLITVTTRDIKEAVELSNLLAPEHLELQVDDPQALLPSVRNAGAVLLGRYTSAPIGDYIAGPSHTLPTAGAARFSSPLSVSTFMKRTSVISYSEEAAREVAEDVARFALAEGFDAHAAAARIRARS